MKQTPVKSTPQVKAGKIGKTSPLKKTPAKKNKINLLLGSDEQAELVKITSSAKKTPLKKLTEKNVLEMEEEKEVMATLTAKNPRKTDKANKNAEKMFLHVSDEDVEENGSGAEEEDNEDVEALNISNGDDEDSDLNFGSDDNEDEDSDNDDDDDEGDDEDEDGGNIYEIQEDNETDDQNEADEDEKKSNKKAQITKLNKGKIPSNYPREKVVRVNNVSKDAKEVDILEAFSKFGPVHTINIMKGPVLCSADVAFKTVEAAEAAIASSKKVELLGLKLKISARPSHVIKETATEKMEKRTIYVKKVPYGTTVDDMKTHFSSCGDIESVKLFSKTRLGYAFVHFTNANAVEKALLLNNSILNDCNIAVYRRTANASVDEGIKEEDIDSTIVVRNTQNFKSIDIQKLHDIFGKCGPVKKIKVICGTNILAFITYSNSKAIEKAFKLDNTEQNGMEIKLERCIPPNKTATFVGNLASDVTVEDLNELFSTCGEIKNITLKRNAAIIRFNDSDAFCKSFLLNEHRLKNRMIFLKPYSIMERNTKKRPFNSHKPKGMQKTLHQNMQKPQKNNNINNKNNKRLKLSS